MKKLAWALVPMTVVAVSVSGCSTQLHRPIGLTVGEPPLAPEFDRAAITISDETCTKTAEVVETENAKTASGLGSVLIGTGVDFAVSAAGEWIKSRQLRRNAVWSASGVVSYCDPTPGNPTVRNVTIERAVIDSSGDVKGTAGFELTGKLTFQRFAGDAPADAESDGSTASVDGTKSEHEAEAAKSDSTHKVSTQAAKPSTLQITWTDTDFKYGRTAARDRGSKRKHVVVLLGFAPSAILTTGEKATGSEKLPGVIRLDLGYVQDGYSYSGKMLEPVKAVSTIAVPPNNTLNVTAIVVETEDESLALKALTSAFESNKAGIADALKGQAGGSTD